MVQITFCILTNILNSKTFGPNFEQIDIFVGDGHSGLFGGLRTNSFESTWQIEHFSSDHVLIPSNKQRGSKTIKELRSGNIGSKSTKFVVGSDSIVTYPHSLTQKDNIVVYAL